MTRAPIVLRLPGIILLSLGLANATTLQRLTLDEMITKSSNIVRVKVQSNYGAMRTGVIYTFYRLQVAEQWKGVPAQTMEVAVPGGVFQGRQQPAAGSPKLTAGGEYVILTWTSPTGLVQIIGLTQGLFEVKKNAGGEIVLARPAFTETMIDKSGNVIKDEAVEMKLSDLKSRVAKLVGGR